MSVQYMIGDVFANTLEAALKISRILDKPVYKVQKELLSLEEYLNHFYPVQTEDNFLKILIICPNNKPFTVPPYLVKRASKIRLNPIEMIKDSLNLIQEKDLEGTGLNMTADLIISVVDREAKILKCRSANGYYRITLSL